MTPRIALLFCVVGKRRGGRREEKEEDVASVFIGIGDTIVRHGTVEDEHDRRHRDEPAERRVMQSLEELLTIDAEQHPGDRQGCDEIRSSFLYKGARVQALSDENMVPKL